MQLFPGRLQSSHSGHRGQSAGGSLSNSANAVLDEPLALGPLPLGTLSLTAAATPAMEVLVVVDKSCISSSRSEAMSDHLRDIVDPWTGIAVLWIGCWQWQLGDSLCLLSACSADHSLLVGCRHKCYRPNATGTNVHCLGDDTLAAQIRNIMKAARRDNKRAPTVTCECAAPAM